jgi:hypothetical protein
MFLVTITPEARALLLLQFARETFAKPGLTILRQGARGEVTRSNDRQAEWKVERPHPWRALVGDFASFGENPTDVQTVEGIPVWLALVPRPDECGVKVSVRNEELFVEAEGA